MKKLLNSYSFKVGSVAAIATLVIGVATYVALNYWYYHSFW